MLHVYTYAYTVSFSCICRFKQTKYENVGERLALRKELFRKRRTISDVAFVTALIGIILMIIHIELLVRKIGSKYSESIDATVLKIFITVFTLALIGLVIWFHLIDVKVSPLIVIRIGLLI